MSEHMATNNITCPHCGYEHIDSWEYDDEDGVIECHDCDRSFHYSRSVFVTYDSRPVRQCKYLDDHGMNCSWEQGDPHPDADERCRPCVYDDYWRQVGLASISDPREE